MITLTPKAAEIIQQQLDKRGKGLGIRLGVKSTGCSGLGYVLEFVDTPNSDDVRYSSNGATVFVDAKSIVYLEGMEVDYVRNGLNEEFEFNNPNVKGECGCGSSFSV